MLQLHVLQWQWLDWQCYTVTTLFTVFSFLPFPLPPCWFSFWFVAWPRATPMNLRQAIGSRIAYSGTWIPETQDSWRWFQWEAIVRRGFSAETSRLWVPFTGCRLPNLGFSFEPLGWQHHIVPSGRMHHWHGSGRWGRARFTIDLVWIRTELDLLICSRLQTL